MASAFAIPVSTTRGQLKLRKEQAPIHSLPSRIPELNFGYDKQILAAKKTRS
jgi:hypothetical protein